MVLSDEWYLLAEACVALMVVIWHVCTRKLHTFFARTTVGWLFVASVMIVLIGNSNSNSPRGRFWICAIVLVFLLMSMLASVTVRDDSIFVRGWFTRRRFRRDDIDRLETVPSWPDEYGESSQRLWLSLRDGSRIDLTSYRPLRALVSALDLPVREENNRYARMLRRTDIWQSICRCAVVLAFIALVFKLAATYIVIPLTEGSWI